MASSTLAVTVADAPSLDEKVALVGVDTPEAGDPADDNVRYIVTSPYETPEHLLDLSEYEPQVRLLARALTVLDKTRDDYATAPYSESFSYAAVIEALRKIAPPGWKRSHFFVVAFRSQIPPTTDYGDLGRLDEAAHAEATASGGLLRYWFENPDANGRNLATCVWHSADDARRAGHGPLHRTAAGAVRALYSEWRIERYRLEIDDDVASWSVTPWVD